MGDLVSRVIDLAVQIQQIPGPTFSEGQRAEFVRGLFLKEGLKDVSMDSLGNVYGRLPSNSPGQLSTGKPLVAVAHLDTVFPAKVNLQIRREAGRIYGPGIGDNSLGVAALFGLLWSIHERKIRLKSDVWLVADVGEEGLGDLRGMRAVVERFESQVTGYLIVEGLALGHVYHRAIGVRRYRITARTPGGHSWSDYGQPSAVHELAALITQLTSLALPREPRTTLNIGTISGGTGINVLAAEATCELDLRSESPSVLSRLVAQAEELIYSANRSDVQVSCEVIGQRPAGEIPARHSLVQIALDCTRAQGLDPILTAGSTDANIPLNKGLPAVVMGVTTGGGAHSVHEFMDTEPVKKGLEALVSFVCEVNR